MYALAGCCYNTAKRESHRYTYSRAAPIFLHSQVSMSMCVGYTFGKGGGAVKGGRIELSNVHHPILSPLSLSVSAFQNEGELLFC